MRIFKRYPGWGICQLFKLRARGLCDPQGLRRKASVYQMEPEFISLDDHACSKCGAVILLVGGFWECDCFKIGSYELGLGACEVPDFWISREELKEDLLRGFHDYNHYVRNRFYLRGWTPLGLINTLTGCLFNRVLVKHMNNEGKIIKWTIGVGTDFPRSL